MCSNNTILTSCGEKEEAINAVMKFCLDMKAEVMKQKEAPVSKNKGKNATSGIREISELGFLKMGFLVTYQLQY